MTQQVLAERAGIHVSMIRRYETDVAQPSIEVLRKLAVTLSVPSDALLFEDGEREPSADLRLHFEAVQQMSPEQQQLVRQVLDALVLRPQVGQWAAKG